MDLEKIEKLIKLMNAHGLHEIKLKEGNDSVCLTQNPPVLPSQQMPVFNMAAMSTTQNSERVSTPSQATQIEESKSTKRDANLIEIRSPFVGTYYASSAPGADPFVSLGKKVSKGDTLCIVEAMKLMNEIEAERDAVLAEILVQNEQPVEYDQVLFLMKPL